MSGRAHTNQQMQNISFIIGGLIRSAPPLEAPVFEDVPALSFHSLDHHLAIDM